MLGYLDHKFQTFLVLQEKSELLETPDMLKLLIFMTPPQDREKNCFRLRWRL